MSGGVSPIIPGVKKVPVSQLPVGMDDFSESESQARANGDASSWPEPQPLPDGLAPVEAFDLAMLPTSLQPWAKDICELMQCPPDYVGVTIMAALGTVLGRQVGIRPQAKTVWTEVPNQWALIVGRPGVLKSPAMEAALEPLKLLVAQEIDKYETEAEDYSLKKRVAKIRTEEGERAARAALKDDSKADVSRLLAIEEPEEPTLKRFIANDTTPAALGELLRQNHNGVLVFRDELVSLLKGLDREDNAEGRGFYLTGWNGNSAYTFDRIGRGMNLRIPAVCLSVLGSTQPGRISGYINAAIKGGAADDGLIQRFGLMVWPDMVPWQEVDRWPNNAARKEANQVFERLHDIGPLAIGAEQDSDYNGHAEGIPYLRFGKEGQALFSEWRASLEARLRSDDLYPAIESHLAKYRSLVPGLALIIHLAEDGTGPVSEDATIKALAWAQYLESHVHRIYGAGTHGEVRAAKAIIRRIKKGDLPRRFSSRDVWRPGWANLRDRKSVGEALELLVDLDRLRQTEKPTLGRTATEYEANPRGLDK